MKRSGQAEVLYMSSVDISIGNGPGVNEREFVAVLQKTMGDRIHFLIPRPRTPVPDVDSPTVTLSEPLNRRHPLQYARHVLSQIRLANQLMQRSDYKFLITRLDVLPLAQVWITRRYRRPYVIKTLGQGVLNALGDSGGRLGKAVSPVGRAIVGNVVRNALGIDVCTRKFVDFFEGEFDLNRERILWVENAVNTERFFPRPMDQVRASLGLERFEQIIGFVGGRPWERGASQIVESLPALRQEFPRMGAVIVGDGEGMPALKERARELGVEDLCVFTGYVPLDKVPFYINTFDIGVSLFLVLNTDLYGASEQKVRQYLACGKPVIAGPNGNAFLAEEQIGSIVEPTDIVGVQEQIRYWLKLPPEQREATRQRALEYARTHLSVKSTLAQRFAFWNRLLAEQSGRYPASSLSFRFQRDEVAQ